MTVSSDLSRVSYAGDGATSLFAVPFYFLDADDPKVILRDAAGAETNWTRGTHYTLSGAGSPTGGALTVSTSPTDHTPASGETLVILRRVPLTQETDYTEGDPLPAATLERDFDKARMIDQQLAETLGRTLKFADSSTVSGITVPDPAADQVLKWNAAADGLENWATVTDIAAVAGVVDDIDTLGPIAANVTTVAGIAGDVTTVATNLADVSNFADVYIGPAASDPTTRADSSALQTGDLYFNTTADEMRVYDGAAWQAAYLPSASYLAVANNLSDLGDAATSRTNLGLGTAAVEAVAAGGSGDLLRADGDGSGLAGITAGASATDMRLAFLLIAENSGDRLNMVDGIADPFADESDVDTATSTNENYDASGDFYATKPGSYGSDLTTGTTATQSGGTLASNGNDDNSGTIFPGGNQASGFWWEANITSSAIVTKWTFRTGSNATDVGRISSIALQGYNGSWNTVDTLSGSLSTSTTYTRDSGNFTNTTSYSDYRLLFTLSSAAAAFGAEVEMFEDATPLNMTLVSNPFTADSAPATGRIHAQVKENEAVTVNTDLMADVSRDGGTTWTAATLALVEALGDGTKAYEDAGVDISGQPSGTAMKWRLRTANTKDIEAHGIVFQWS